MKVYRVGPETERMRLRAPEIEEADAFYRLNRDPQVTRYTGEPALASLDEAREAIATYPDFDTVGFGRWSCLSKDNGTYLGFCGLKYLEDLDEVDVGFRFLPEFWGQGLATEACVASLQFGLEVIGLERIIALVLPENLASIRVVEKSGMTAAGPVDYTGLRPEKFVIEASP